MQVSPDIYSSILQCKCRNVKKITPQQKFDLHQETSKEMLFLNTVEAQGYAKVNKYGDIHLLLYFSVFSFHVIVIKNLTFVVVLMPFFLAREFWSIKTPLS